MTQRKRKSPEKMPPAAPPPRFLARSARALAGLLARNPTLVGGIVVFFVIYGFIAANALWYQPGRHPQPLFRTRDDTDFTTMAGLRRSPVIEPDPSTVTTFRISRVADGEAEPAPAESVESFLERQEGPPLVRAIQSELSRRGLYGGAVDGAVGPATAAAIAQFQRRAGLPVTGLTSPELLAALRSADDGSKAVALQRPVEDFNGAIDPVAAAILNAERADAISAPLPPVPVPVPALRQVADARPGQAPRNDASSIADQTALVMSIQRGLSNIAYAEVSVDGIAGEQTKAAIRHFERHYRLPETGEPNERVLKKLKDIGAL